MDDNARALRHERITLLSDMVQRLRAELARLNTDADGLRVSLAQARAAEGAERAKRESVEKELAQLQERLKGIEDRTVAHVRETLWGEPTG